MFLVSYKHKQKTHLMAIGDGGHSEPTATNAPISRFVQWMGYVFSFGVRWVHHNPILFVVDHCIKLFFLFLSSFPWT
jgi:hypothetical protein